jgi:hypothetical protein
MAGGLSTGTHQPTGGRFSSNNLPVGLPQVYARSSLKRKVFFSPTMFFDHIAKCHLSVNSIDSRLHHQSMSSQGEGFFMLLLLL